VTPAPWWKTAVIYQIYPRSFADTNGDGIGDLPGIHQHLDHLSWLGIDAIWVSPFYRSPMADFGYDVSDYCDVDPLFGTLRDFDSLLEDAHGGGIRVLVDWVPNHTSDQHPWFLESRPSRQSPKRSWYWWRPDRPSAAGGMGPPGSRGRRPNNWRAAFGGPAWTWHEPTQQWYLHLFLPEQPDLNWANRAVADAMHDTLRFWLDRGVDGFRIDVVHGLSKDPALPDMPPDLAREPASSFNDQPGTHHLILGFRRVLEEYQGDRVMVGEVYLLSTPKVAAYYGTPSQPELHLAFNFPPLYAPWDAEAWRTCISDVLEHFERRDGWPTWVLSNHDNPRHRTRYGGNEDRARAAAVLLLTLRGTPFLYQGEELGLEDATVPPDHQVDPGGRDGCRAPIPWDGTPNHGWSGRPPWLPWPPGADGNANVAAQRADPGSMLHLYRRLLAARRGSPALQLGSLTLLDTPENVVGYVRAGPAGSEARTALINFAGEPSDPITLPDRWLVEVASDAQGEGQLWTGKLLPDQAVLLMPARGPNPGLLRSVGAPAPRPAVER
jgi:alpha-glucosidase